MTEFVARDNETHLGVDRIFTSPTARALYNNLLALAEGTSGAPKIELSRGSVSAAVASLDLVLTAFTHFRSLEIRLTGWRPATDGANLTMRVSTDGGASFDTANNYEYGNYGLRFGVGASNTTSGATSTLNLTANGSAVGPGNAAAEGLNAVIELLNITNAARFSQFLWRASFIDASAGAVGQVNFGGGRHLVAQDTDAIRLFMSSGNIAEGEYVIYGRD